MRREGVGLLTLPAAENVPIAVPIAAQAPNAKGSDLARTPAMNPAAHPPAAAFIASSVYVISTSVSKTTRTEPEIPRNIRQRGRGLTCRMLDTADCVNENENPIAAASSAHTLSHSFVRHHTKCVVKGNEDIPKKAIVPPVLVTTPIAPLSCLRKVSYIIPRIPYIITLKRIPDSLFQRILYSTDQQSDTCTLHRHSGSYRQRFVWVKHMGLGG